MVAFVGQSMAKSKWVGLVWNIVKFLALKGPTFFRNLFFSLFCLCLNVNFAMHDIAWNGNIF